MVRIWGDDTMLILDLGLTRFIKLEFIGRVMSRDVNVGFIKEPFFRFCTVIWKRCPDCGFIHRYQAPCFNEEYHMPVARWWGWATVRKDVYAIPHLVHEGIMLALSREMEYRFPEATDKAEKMGIGKRWTERWTWD